MHRRIAARSRSVPQMSFELVIGQETRGGRGHEAERRRRSEEEQGATQVCSGEVRRLEQNLLIIRAAAPIA
jgi:hypothetical protein